MTFARQFLFQRRAVALVLTAALCLVVLPEADVRAAEDVRSFTSDWECEETALVFHVDEAVLEPYVPDRFEMIVKGGKVQFGVFAEDCLVGVDEGEMSRTVLSGVTIEVDNPDGSPGDSFAYDLHWGTDSATYFDALDRLGSGDFIPGSTYTSTPSPALLTDVAARVEWTESPFSISAQVVGTNPERVPFTSVHWVDAKRGYTRSTYPHEIMVSVGQGTLTTTSGTILYDILGAEQLTAPALFGRFTVEDAVTDLVVEAHDDRRPNDRSFEMNGSCVEIALSVPVDRDIARDYVPEEFELITIDDKALFAVFAEDCEMAVDDGPLWPNVFSGAFFFVHDPLGGTDPHAYDILWGTDSKDLYQELGDLGFGDYVPGSTFEVASTAGELHSIEASIPWRESSFSISATAVEPPPQHFPFTSVHWQVGRHGPVRGTYPHDLTAHAAVGTITAEPGSAIAEILGGEETNAGGLILEFDFTGVVEIVPL